MNDDFLNILRSKNIERQSKWNGSEKVDNLFRAVELGEEAGEVLGAVKKYFRGSNNIKGNQKSLEEILENLEDEIGDVLITLDLLALQYNIDLQKCTTTKFNKTSKKNDIAVYIVDV